MVGTLGHLSPTTVPQLRKSDGAFGKLAAKMRSTHWLTLYGHIIAAKNDVRNAGMQGDTTSMCVFDAGNKPRRVNEIAIFQNPRCARLVQSERFGKNTLKLMNGSGIRQRLRLPSTNRAVQSDPDQH